MMYKAPMTCFHTFEADSSMAGIYFADEREGAHFLSAVNFRLSKIQNRENRRSVRPSKSPQPESKYQSGGPHLKPIREPAEQTGSGQKKKAKKKAKKAPERPKITKADIGMPTNFMHVKGVKSTQAGMEMVDNSSNVDEAVRELLSVSGLDASVLRDPQKKKEIYNFVEQNEVVPVVKKMTVRRETMKPRRVPAPVMNNSNVLSNVASQPKTQQLQPIKEPSTSVGGVPPPPPPPPPPPSPPPLPPPPPAESTIHTPPSIIEPEATKKEAPTKQNVRSKPGKYMKLNKCSRK